jgi:uncharacterized OsmC-like protein
MKSEDLKRVQSPLKEKYRNDPSSAVITLKASGKVGEGISCTVETGRILVEAGLHPAAGGNGILACSGDLLLEALVACAGVTLSAVATSMGIELKGGTIRAEGDLDFRGTLGVSRDIPVGFSNIRVWFDLDCNASGEKVETLLKLTERYCVVFQTIKQGTSAKAFINLKNADPDQVDLH